MNTKSKKLTSKAGLTIPKDMRFDAGFTGGMAVDLERTNEGILIKQHLPTCRFCGSVESVGKVKGMEICAKCALEIKKEVEAKYAG